MNSKKIVTSLLSLCLLLALLVGVFAPTAAANVEGSPFITQLDKDLNIDLSQFFNSSVLYQLPEGIDEDEEISLILQTDEKTLLDAYDASGSSLSFANWCKTDEAKALSATFVESYNKLIEALNKKSISYEIGEHYDTLFVGLEITVRAKYFEDVCYALGSKVNVIVGEVYEPADAEIVTNKVNVYDTGIFNSQGSNYDGSGMVVAVLDTGCDYTHSVFALENFTSNNLGLTFEELSTLVGNTIASTFHESLTAEDVYVNAKIPYAYDYADKDSDVMPINSEHGTHVAGIIAGKDRDDKTGDRITGVAPNAQLAIMKVFSDFETGAKTSWMLAALEDCVNIGVDVINMSLGSNYGFSRDLDNARVNEIYNSIRERGISLVVSAGNSYNSTHGSQKNGNLGLTSNPDSAAVGSPSTYKASLSVASIDGVPTHYILFNDQIIYYIEASDRVSEEKDFVEDLLGAGQESMTVEYVLIPGIGCEADYMGIDVSGKIALVSRGNTTFEEKANTAEDMGALGVIIYNNVSGDIKMTVGDTKIAVCSISQDDGEMLAAQKTGKITISKQQAAGPFMSDFSSWGPGPDLEIKPEITAHGGSILSAVPGQDYERMSGTSMAAPNTTGVTTLLRQYVIETFFNDQKDNFGNLSAENQMKVTAMVNRLMMSTADIVNNKNGLPYSVRKQGAGLVNLTDSITTDAYILTYDRKDGSVMDKSKIELGDDPLKTGVYTLNFAIENFGTSAVSYDLWTYVMTEGVSETLTTDGKTTVTEEGYILEGATVEIASISGGTKSGNTVTVGAGSTANLSVKITLSDSDKKYLDDSFANGMYVEGYVMLTAKDGTKTGLNVPYLAFYGDWTVAPIFDIDYFETNADELDDSIDLLDKVLPDAYATRPIGGLYNDYVSYLGAYYYMQKPGTSLIAADRKYISLSNQDKSINSIRSVWAGLLRNCESVIITITDNATGEVIYTKTEYGIRKSPSNGSQIYGATIDIEYSIADHDLKNNSAYTVTLTGMVDYGDGGAANNVNNTFSFPFVTDFEAPTVTGCEFYTEYDKASKTNRLYAKIAVYDNHYSMAMIPGYVYKNSESGLYSLASFEQYPCQIYSNFNSTSYVVYELTDYIDNIKEDAHNKNSFTLALFDYALNESVYEITLPDKFVDLYFSESEITLSPNQTYSLNPIVYPETEWTEMLYYESADESVVRVINNQLVAIGSGTTTVKAMTRLDGRAKTATLTVNVLSEGDEGYRRYDKPVVSHFELTGYDTIKAYYMMSSEDRDIGLEGAKQVFYSNYYGIKLFPSETVKLSYEIEDYFDNTEVVFKSSNSNIVTVDEDGTIRAVAEGFASVSVNVLADGKSTFYSKTVNIEVKKPYETMGPMLMHYYGLGGKVEIPATLGVTEIYEYAFSNCKYIEKNLEEGDVITEEDPLKTKPYFIGDDTITEIVIPEGIKTIGSFAFAGLTKLEKVTLPSTLVTIGQGAFQGCESLTLVAGLENVKFINAKAFLDCDLTDEYSLDNTIAVSDRAFEGNKNLTKIVLPASAHSVGSYTFSGCEKLAEIVFESEKIKIGDYTFENCTSLTEISINTAVISRGSFFGCTSLNKITIGKDTSQIGEYAFSGTAIASFTLDKDNAAYKASSDGSYLVSKADNKLVLIAPAATTVTVTDATITTVAMGAASGNKNIVSFTAPSVTKIEKFAFSECEKLATVSTGALTQIGDYAFYNTRIAVLPSLASVDRIGSYAFSKTNVVNVTIPDGVEIGSYAFSECQNLRSITIGDGVTVGDYAFYYDKENNFESSYYVENEKQYFYFVLKSPVSSLTIGKNAIIGKGAFMGNSSLTEVTLGEGARIGELAFFNASSLTTIDLSKVVSIGQQAFAGDTLNEMFYENGQWVAAYDLQVSGMYQKYRYRHYSAKFTSIDLSAATELGIGAFLYCDRLTSVTLGNGVTVVPNYAFAGCAALTTINLNKITEIGDYAFGETALSTATLSSITTIGKYAFTDCASLTTVTLGDNAVKVDEGAFYNCSALTAANGIRNLTEIGKLAFAYTSIREANLANCVTLGAHAFIKSESVAFKLTLGKNLENIGDNPFAYCIIAPIYTNEDVMFNGEKVETKKVYTYDINDKVSIIDGSVYRVVPYGLELVTACANDGTFNVAAGTVRVSSMAFSGSSVKNVILPYTLKSIGDKAFFGCDKLAVVTFTSYNAPILEEQYDYSYFTNPNNWPCTPSSQLNVGLGLVDYYMWTVTSSPSNTFYGANFVNYIGKLDDKLVMVRPSNGLNYSTFIMDGYFSTVIDGKPAADQITLDAIEAISKLPDTVALSDEALVIAARAAYDKISTNEQRALVTEYAKLTKAEKRIEDLKFLESENEPTTPPTDDNPPAPEKDGLPTYAIILIIVGSVLVLAAGAFVLIILIRRKKKSKTSDSCEAVNDSEGSDE